VKGRTLQKGLFNYRNHGGARKGAGAKKAVGAGLTHVAREDLPKGCPVHVTVSLVAGLPSMRGQEPFDLLLECFAKGKEKAGFRLTQFSVQGNHLHLIVEASDKRALTRGMQGLLIRIARGLNRLWQREGPLWADRYHAHVLKTPREVRNALAYVLQNFWKHARARKGHMDVRSSGWWFDGWKERTTFRGLERVLTPVMKARSWLLNLGWRKHRLISIYEVPGRK